MSRKLTLSLSSILMGLCGLILLFLPQEILELINAKDSNSFLVILIQLLAALYIGSAIINWHSKSRLIGGIYNRPLALSNTFHFSVGFLSLLKYQFNHESNYLVIGITIIYAYFALAFFKIMFTTPKNVSN